MKGTRRNFSAVSLNAAYLFSDRVNELEAIHETKGEDSYYNMQAGDLQEIYVLSCIFHVVSFLEANINEFFQSLTSTDSLFTGYSDEHSVDERFHTSLNAVDDAMGRGFPWIRPFYKRYQLMLELADLQPFDEESEPYVSISDLHRLRNYFIHFEYEWLDATPDPTPPLVGGGLKNKRYRTNPLVPEDARFFPAKALSYGCTEWVIDSALDFTDEFHDRIEVDHRYKMLRGLDDNDD